jgi:flavin-binding protein dodecin
MKKVASRSFSHSKSVLDVKQRSASIKKRRNEMSLAKVIEIIAEGSSLEEAIENGVLEASKSVRNIKSVYVEGFQAIIEDNKVAKFRANLKLTFILED